MYSFQTLILTITSTIFSWDYFSEFKKISENTFKIKVQLNILNSLLGEKNIESKFLELVKTYPETREILPLLIAVRDFDKQILNRETLEIQEIKQLFNKNMSFKDQDMIDFFNKSWLKQVFENKYISNLNDYVFWIETWLDSNARKNRTGDLMEDLVEEFVKGLCIEKWFKYKEQATAGFIKNEWWVDVRSDKSSRRFDFAIFNPNNNKIYLLEVNYYGWWWSKLKSVAWEFAWLYDYMREQNIPFYWITDWLGWNTALKPLEEAYNKMEWNIYNLEMLKEGILNELIR